MAPLRDLQFGIRLAVLGGDPSAVASAIRSDGIDPQARLSIYRTAVLSSLGDVLESTFPVVRTLVDPRFFAYAADTFIKAHPPEEPVLACYGGRFADFLAGFAPCAGLPYLPDVARLEWAVAQALVAEDAQAVDPQVLGRLPATDSAGLRLRLHPSHHLLASAFPVDHIWETHRSERGGEESIRLDEGGVRLEIFRRVDQVVFRRLEPAAFAFRHAVAAGRCLEGATETALAVDPFFDLLMALRALLRDRLVVAFDIAPPRSHPPTPTKKSDR